LETGFICFGYKLNKLLKIPSSTSLTLELALALEHVLALELEFLRDELA
jgi:hypothetical protein